jgi:hypothetical protein
MNYDVNIFASFNPESLIDPQQELSKYGNVSTYLNTVPGNQTCRINSHNYNDITKLAITSNGINYSNFNIFPIKYVGEAVQFVIQLQDTQGFEVKDYPLLSLSNLSLSLSQSNGNYVNNVSFSSNFGPLSSLSQGGFFKGYFVSPITADNVSLKAVYIDPNLNLSGYSSTFYIYSSSGLYQLRKVNEDFNQTLAYKSLATQPVLTDKTMLFDAFLGQIVGNQNSDPNTLGIEVYEKISNYISNIDDIDYCNITQLKSLLDNVNATYQNFNYEYPPSLRRLTDILSVKHKKLFGQLNQYEGNFNDKGFVKSSKYGLNKGSQLDVSTSILCAGPGVYPNYIVVYEKFSEQYSVVNMNLINLPSYRSATSTLSTFELSAFNTSWGWDLVLPPNTFGTDISKYYDFYQFKPGIEGSLLQKFIDFNNPNNTLYITNSSYQEYTKEGGIMDNILLYSLYTGTEVLS